MPKLCHFINALFSVACSMVPTLLLDVLYFSSQYHFLIHQFSILIIIIHPCIQWQVFMNMCSLQYVVPHDACGLNNSH